MTFDEATDQSDRVKQFARDRYENDAIFRQMVQTAVHLVRCEHADVGREWSREHYEAAIDAAARAAALAMCDSAMIRMLERERDECKALALKYVSANVLPIIPARPLGT